MAFAIFWCCIYRVVFFNWLHQNLAKSRMKLDAPNFSKCQNLKLKCDLIL